MIASSNAASLLEDRVERVQRKEAASEAHFKMEMKMKEINSNEESKAFKARISYFEDALQQANAGAQNKVGTPIEYDPDVIEYAEGLAEAKIQVLRNGYEAAMNDAREYWNREFQLKEEALLRKDDALSTDRGKTPTNK